MLCSYSHVKYQLNIRPFGAASTDHHCINKVQERAGLNKTKRSVESSPFLLELAPGETRVLAIDPDADDGEIIALTVDVDAGEVTVE